MSTVFWKTSSISPPISETAIRWWGHLENFAMARANKRAAQIIDQAMGLKGVGSIEALSEKIGVGASTLKNWRNSGNPVNAKANHLEALAEAAGLDLGSFYQYLKTGELSPKGEALVDPRIARAKRLLFELLYLFDDVPQMKPVTAIIRQAVDDLSLPVDEGGLSSALSALPKGDRDRAVQSILFEQYTREDIVKIAGALSEALQRDISVEAMLLAWNSGMGGARAEIANSPAEQNPRQTAAQELRSH